MSRFIAGKILSFEDARKRFADIQNINDAVLLNEIKPEDFLYVECRALSANRANANGDYFSKEELLRTNENTGEPVYRSFVGCGVYVNHESDKVEKNIGSIFDAEFIDSIDDPHVRLIIGVDRVKAADVARGLQTGRLNSFSMGCRISFSICSACGKKIINSNDTCDCLKYHRGQQINGVGVYEILHGVEFHEISVVTVPADSSARLVQILAGEDNGRMCKVAFTSDIVILNEIYKKAFNSNMSDKIKMLNKLKETI